MLESLVGYFCIHALPTAHLPGTLPLLLCGISLPAREGGVDGDEDRDDGDPNTTSMGPIDGGING